MSKFNLNEGLGYKDLCGLMKNTVYIDEFSSKMGDDDEIVVASFYVRDRQAAMDLVNWFEKGYDFVLDADMSPGEVKPNRYLVYIEMKRRSYTGDNLETLLSDFNTLTEYEGDNWTLGYKGEEYPFTIAPIDCSHKDDAVDCADGFCGFFERAGIACIEWDDSVFAA